MNNLVFLDMTDASRTPDAEFNYLDNQLHEHGIIGFRCSLPAGTNPASTDMYIKYVDGEYTMWFSDHIRYNGFDVGFSTLCRQQDMSFQSIDEMRQFLRNMNLGQSDLPVSLNAQERSAEAVNPAQRNKPVTDRSQIEIQSRTRRKVDQVRLIRDLGELVCGQKAAVEEVARWATTSAAKTAPTRPVCIMLAGETGTGKTLLAKGLCEAMNLQLSNEQGKYGCIVINCNELVEDHMVARLTGAPAGYIGYGDSTLLSPVISNPYQVIVFDEIEKASVKVLDVLMSGMDTGEITLNKPVDGCNTLNLKHAILIFTTNTPMDKPTEKGTMGFRATSGNDAKNSETRWERMDRYRDVLVKSGIRREIAARFMSIIKFEALPDDAKIDIMLKSIQNCAAQYSLLIGYVTPSVIQSLYDRTGALRYGVRDVNSEVESTLGPAFACYEGETDSMLDIVGTLESPELRIHAAGAAQQSSVTPMAPEADNDEFDPDALGWDHDA